MAIDRGVDQGLGETMVAAIRRSYGSAADVHLGTVAKPRIQEREVRIRVAAAGVDRGVWHLMTGLPYAVRLAGFGVRRPKNPVLGMDVAGEVEAVGGQVTRFRPGDEVMGTADGSFAQFAVTAEDRLVNKPSRLTFQQAAAVATSGTTALQAVRDQGRIRPGQKVLVIGASGGVGTYAVQLAKALGGEVTGVASGIKLNLVRAVGADHVIDYDAGDFTDGSRRYDLIIDIGGNRPVASLRRALTPEGTLVIVGGEGSGRWIGMRRQFRALVMAPFTRRRLRIFITKQRQDDLQLLAQMIDSGKVTPFIDRAYPLSQVPEALRYLEQGRVRGKLVIAVE